MGGYYPTNGGWGAVPLGDPVRDYRLNRDTARNPYHPRRTPTPKKYPWRPPGYFPNGWKPPKTRFGRLPKVVYPTRFPLDRRFARFIPWGTLVFGVAGYMLSPRRIPLPAGWTRCWDYGGDKSARSGPIRAYCPGDPYKLLALQVPSGTGYAPITATTTNLAQAIFFGPYSNPEGTRMQYREMIARPDAVSGTYPNPQIIQPVAPVVVNPDFVLPEDPNDWLPLIGVPFVPVPVPVWVPTPEPVSYPPPVVRGDDVPIVVPVPDIEPLPDEAVELRYRRDTKKGRVWHRTQPHQRTKPTGRGKERKWMAANSRWALLATYLLRSAARVYGGMTEVVDLVSAVYAALPNEVISKHPDNLKPGEVLGFMLHQIYEHIDEVDVHEALENIYWNVIEDAAWGRYFGAVQKVTDRGTNYSGFDRELSELNDLFHQLQAGG